MSISREERTARTKQPIKKKRARGRDSSLLAFALVLSATFIGCNSSASEGLVPVSGVVSWNGKPLSRGRVLFIPGQVPAEPSKQAPRFASGTIGAEGHFQMTSFRLHDGVIPGTYSVVIDDDLPPSAETGRPRPEDVGPLPEKYADEQTSELEVTVEIASEERVINFTLPSKD